MTNCLTRMTKYIETQKIRVEKRKKECNVSIRQLYFLYDHCMKEEEVKFFFIFLFFIKKNRHISVIIMNVLNKRYFFVPLRTNSHTRNAEKSWLSKFSISTRFAMKSYKIYSKKIKKKLLECIRIIITTFIRSSIHI